MIIASVLSSLNVLLAGLLWHCTGGGLLVSALFVNRPWPNRNPAAYSDYAAPGFDQTRPVKAIHQLNNRYGVCGISNPQWSRPRSLRIPDDDERIVGGVTANPGQWPWVVSLTYDGDAKCGASLLTERHLLTAAHCFRDRRDASRWSANLASLDFLEPSEPGERHIRLAEFRIHPNNGRQSRDDFDIAVVKLSSPVTFADKIRPICLSERPAVAGEVCTVAGWGLTFFTAPYNLLNQVSVPIIPGGRCNSSAFPDLAGRITDSMFCAGYPQGGRDACDGDSGGPIMCKRGNAWFQFGVVSWGSGCGGPQAPGVYARTDGTTKQWIESIVGQPL